MQCPAAYKDSLSRCSDDMKDAAENYIAHTPRSGDPELDPIMEELSSISTNDLHRFIEAGIEQQDRVFRAAPRCLRDFFDNLEEPACGWTTKHLHPGYARFRTMSSRYSRPFVGRRADPTSSRPESPSRSSKRAVSSTTGSRGSSRTTATQVDEYSGPVDSCANPTAGNYRSGSGSFMPACATCWPARANGMSGFTAHRSAPRIWATRSRVSRPGPSNIRPPWAPRYTREERESFCAVWRYAGYLMGIPGKHHVSGRAGRIRRCTASAWPVSPSPTRTRSSCRMPSSIRRLWSPASRIRSNGPNSSGTSSIRCRGC